MWVTADGRIRHELLPNGRYDEAQEQQEKRLSGTVPGARESHRLLGRYRLHGR
jgi:hypothetical protein